MAWLTVLGIPAAVYVASMTALMFYLGERTQNLVVLLGAGFLTAGIYIFHRTSIAAVEPMQTRHRLAVRHKHLLRGISWCLLASATTALALHHLLSALLVFGAVVGIILYGRKTITKPIREVLVLKPLAVGIAIGLFAWALNDFANSIAVFIAFVLICSADALLCDVEDCAYDSASGCTTLASKYGARGAWFIAGMLYMFAAICLQSDVGFLFLVLFFIPLLLQNSTRTAVDLRPLLVLLIAWSL